MEKVKRRREHQGVDDNMAVGSDEKSLVKLNRQVIQAIQAYNRTEAQWTDWTDHVFELEDINRWDFLQKVRIYCLSSNISSRSISFDRPAPAVLGLSTT